jgi:ATP-dependent DNA helicase RecG
MLEIQTLDDIAALRESADIECKLAAGKDCQGELPKDFWGSYSAFSNSGGGDVLLGLEEKKSRFSVGGIQQLDRVLDNLWNLVNNPQKASVNLLRESDVRVIPLEGQNIIHIHVPAAARKQRPVYVGGNPITGTYKRNHSGDFLCDEETVRRMMAEQVEDSRDNEILFGFGLDDLDADTFKAYRQLYVSLQPDHPWNEADARVFLRNIGGWRMDRESGKEGLTRAGLLMFGQLPSIQECFPNYMLDYQERPQATNEARWIDRLTLDGSWPGNLFDFYRRVIKKLTSDLKVPFSLEGDVRQDNTLVHQALREALINTLVHADYTGRASVLVVKRPHMFGFRNPGLMRVPQEQAVQGGDSDCRNRLIHQMFRYVGLGEQAGSGVPKIYRGWDSQHWRTPLLYEKDSPSEQTLLELRMLDLLPEGVVENLKVMLGKGFDELSHLERLILATAMTEQVVSHGRMAEITTEHAHDLTLAFQALSKKELLVAYGRGRGTVYRLPGNDGPTADQVFGEHVPGSVAMSEAGAMSGANDGSSGHNEQSSGHNEQSSGYSQRDSNGCLLVEGLSRPLIDRLDLLASELGRSLVIDAWDAQQSRRLPPEAMAEIVLDLCKKHYLTLPVLCELLVRKPESLRKNTLKPLVDSGKLVMAFPDTPTHPRQAYTVNVRHSSTLAQNDNR